MPRYPRQDSQLFPATRNLDFLLTRENRLVNLRREVFRKLPRKLLQSPGLVRQLVLTLLQFCDVGIDGDRASVVGLALAHQNPAAVAALLNERAARFSVTGQAFPDPVLDPAFYILDVTALGGASNDAFERHAGRYLYAAAGIEKRSIFVVAHNQAIFTVVERERFRNALNCDRHSPSAFANLPLVRLLELDSRVPKDAERVGHSADLVAVVATRHVDRRVAPGQAGHRRGYPLDGPHNPGRHVPHCD